MENMLREVNVRAQHNHVAIERVDEWHNTIILLLSVLMSGGGRMRVAVVRGFERIHTSKEVGVVVSGGTLCAHGRGYQVVEHV